ncbi:MAG: hypothetical protein KGJ60_06080 [Verrucomicrobiota bacterium]|nr:hypothetical protein [Verrucomicrobiota bacterium]
MPELFPAQDGQTAGKTLKWQIHFAFQEARRIVSAKEEWTGGKSSRKNMHHMERRGILSCFLCACCVLSGPIRRRIWVERKKPLAKVCRVTKSTSQAIPTCNSPSPPWVAG